MNRLIPRVSKMPETASLGRSPVEEASAHFATGFCVPIKVDVQSRAVT